MTTNAKESAVGAIRRHPGAIGGSDYGVRRPHHPDRPRSGPEGLPIGAVRSLSCEEFPNHLAAVLHCEADPAGLPGFRQHRYSWSALEYFLEHWRNRLSGVVFAGREPLAHPALPAAVRRVRELGFAIALQTDGRQPQRLAELLPQLSWVSLHIPVGLGDARAGDGREGLSGRVRQSLARLLAAGVPFECRTEVRWGMVMPASVRRLAEELAALGVRNYTVAVSNATFLPEHMPGMIDAEEEAVLWHGLRERFGCFSLRERFEGAA